MDELYHQMGYKLRQWYIIIQTEMAAIRQLKLVVYEKGPGESLKDFRPENWTFVITYFTHL
jgi:hypothetical protein